MVSFLGSKNLSSSGVSLGQFHRSFGSFSTRVGKVYRLKSVRQQRNQLLGKLHLRELHEFTKNSHVHMLIQLSFDCLHHTWIPVSDVVHGKTRYQVDITFSRRAVQVYSFSGNNFSKAWCFRGLGGI